MPLLGIVDVVHVPVKPDTAVKVGDDGIGNALELGNNM
jgi:hypothetical protein